VGRGFSPLDEELGLTSASLTPHALEGLVRLAAWIPFRRAAEVLASLTGVQVSEATARRWTEAAGEAACAVQDEQADTIRETLPPAPLGAERLLVSADGAFVPLLHGEWAEAKLLVIGEVTTDSVGEPQTRALTYFAQVAEAETFSQAALVETHQRGVECAEVVCAVLDGAEWLQGLVDDHRPDAVRILDFAHAAGYVSQIGQAVQAAGTALAQTWLTKQLHALKHDGPAQVLSDLRVLAGAHPYLEEVQGALAYLEKREGQMQYPTYQAVGWPIGSGSVESGHKVVMQARLKGAGMHWNRTHVNPLLALRTVECNDRWRLGWADVGAWHQRARSRRRHARAEARLVRICGQLCYWYARLRVLAPPTMPHQVTPAQVGVGPLSRRPAATHPWRRPLITDRCPAAKT
jgi:hypothetical protein